MISYLRHWGVEDTKRGSCGPKTLEVGSSTNALVFLWSTEYFRKKFLRT
jgi:hypothetical protein